MQASASGASVTGLKGCKTLNKDPDPKNPVEGREERSVWIPYNSNTHTHTQAKISYFCLKFGLIQLLIHWWHVFLKRILHDLTALKKEKEVKI